jgi:AcrR family transcriptional regulator
VSDANDIRPLKFRRRAEARPDEVLDAALALFMERGFAATRVEDIGKRAGVSKGTVYLYFPSKEAILEGLVRRAIVPVANSTLSALTDFEGNPRDIIALVIKALGQRFADPKIQAIPRIVLREVLGFPHLAAMYRTEVLDRALPVLERLIRNGIAAGYLRPVDPALTVRSIVGPVLLHVLLAEVFDITPPDGLELDRLVDNHLSILFDGLAAEPAP